MSLLRSLFHLLALVFVSQVHLPISSIFISYMKCFFHLLDMSFVARFLVHLLNVPQAAHCV